MTTVTFDTNTLDKACRPERFPKDPDQIVFQKINDALKSGDVAGYYSATMLTIEGIQNADRAKVFSGTKLTTSSGEETITSTRDIHPDIRAKIGNDDITTVPLNITVSQPDRAPLHPEVLRRVKAAHGLGVKVLKAVPRIGAFSYDDPDGKFYLSNNDRGQLSEWLKTVQGVASAIEGRGVGFARIKALGQKIGEEVNPQKVWFRSLDDAKDVHEENAVKRAFREWADGDSVSSHIAYGIDIFCTGDEGKSNADKSILDAQNREWLEQKYDVRFMTVRELLNHLESAGLV